MTLEIDFNALTGAGIAAAVVAAFLWGGRWLAKATASQAVDQIGDRLEPRITAVVQRETEPLHAAIHSVERLVHDTRNDLEHHIPQDPTEFANGARRVVDSLNEGYHDRRQIKDTLADLGKRFAELETRIEQALEAAT